MRQLRGVAKSFERGRGNAGFHGSVNVTPSSTSSTSEFLDL